MTNLPRGVATIHSQVTSSHEAASIAEQEDSGATVLFRSGETGKHVLFGPLVATVGKLDEQFLNHSGDNVARGDGVHADVVGTPFSSEVAGELKNSSLASVICGANKAL